MRSAVMGLLALVTTSGPADDAPRVQYDTLVTEFNTADESAIEALTKATGAQERSKASLERPLPDEFAPRFFAIAEQHPEDPAALDALCWVASKCLFGPQAEKALGMIGRDHSRRRNSRTSVGNAHAMASRSPLTRRCSEPS